MIIFRKATAMTRFVDNQRKKGLKTGFVPTMGALHPGHISLVQECLSSNDIGICSIFVNPTQFNNPSDFKKYPHTLENDISLLEAAGCHALFLPDQNEIYPEGFVAPHYPLGFLENTLEGAYRPGHFQGVCMVVHRLVNIIPADNLYLGQKDYQQCMVIRSLISQLQLPITLHISPTIREADGLAMSSRNLRLSASERQTAKAIYQTFIFLKDRIQPGPVVDLQQQAISLLQEKGFQVDYVALCKEELEPITYWNGKDNIQALIAAYLNEIRLIDNMQIAG